MDAATTKTVNDASLVGRDDEMAVLSRLLDRTSGGSGQLVLISGEPGIGKTHLVRAFSDHARATGALCLTGMCDEDTATPPYWPWIRIARSLAGITADTALSALLKDDADLNDVPVAPTAPAVKRSTFTAEQPSQLEFRLFNAITRHLIGYASGNVLVLVFDNLHAADQQSLRLLEFVARQCTGARLLVLGTYRDIAISRKHPLSDTLGALGRGGTLTRLRLKGLSREAVAQVIAREVGQTLSENAIETIYERTEGNPLFVTEIARGVAEELSRQESGPVRLRLPDGIREAIGRRLNHLPDDCIDLLGAASVIGRVFLLDELAALVSGRQRVELLEALQPAVLAGILEIDEPAIRLQFSHMLIRDTLYDELPIARRLRLHRDFADALVRSHAEYPDPVLGKIARHYYQAIQAGCVQQAVDYATRAANHASHMLAFEEAVAYYELAIDALTLDPGDRRRRTAELHLCLGRSHHQAGHTVEANRGPLEKAMRMARDCSHHECFVDAACQYVFQTLDEPNERAVAVCNAALELLPEDNTADRARVLIHKSVALKIVGRRNEAERLVYEALSLARRAGRSDVLCEVLSWGNFSLRGRPEKLSECIALGEECLEAAASNDDLAVRVDVMKWLLLSYQEAGDSERGRRLAAEFTRDAESYRSTHHRYVSAGVNAYYALMDGAWARAEELIHEAYRLGQGSGNEGAEGVFGTQMFLLNRELGRLPAFRPALERFRKDGNQPPWRPGLVCMLIEVDALDDARAVYTELLRLGLDRLPRDEMYVATLALLASACTTFRDEGAAGDLYELLLPYSGQMAVQPTAVCFGPADLYLAGLARLARAREDALVHAGKALALAEFAQSPPWVAYARHLMASVLASSGDASHREQAADLVAAATDTARRYGMVRLLDRIRSSPAISLDAPNPDDLSPRELEVLQLIAAGRSNKEISQSLFISQNTVATHVRSILQKTRSANRTEAAAHALRLGIGPHGRTGTADGPGRGV